MEQFNKHHTQMKTHHNGVYSSVIDIVGGRMIVINTLIEKKEKKQSFLLQLKMSLIEFGIWDLKKHEKWGIIKQGIDVNGRDKWDRMWWNGCDNKGYLWNIWLDEMIWWIEREKREIENCYWK